MPDSPAFRQCRKWLVPAVKLLIVLLVGWCIRGTLLDAWRQLGREPRHFSYAWMLACGAFYLLGLLPAALYWHYVLKTLGQPVRLGETLRAYYVGHLGKYVPGKAMVVVLRTALIRSSRVNATAVVVGVFYETLTMMAVGAFLAGAIVAWRLHHEPVLFWGSLAMTALAGLPTLPPVFRRLTRWLRWGRVGRATRANWDRIGYRTLVVGWFSMAGLWIIMALSLWAAFRAVGVTEFDFLDRLPEFLAAVALAVVGGFLSFIPGGLGVRDLLLVELLDKLFHLPAAPALLVSALLRLLWLLAELLVFAVLYFPTGIRTIRRTKREIIESY